ncbi:MAG: glycosyltransferase [Clostridiales bacterium]|nr:glycosyltransferase [Clostridiales bacterium]
MGVDTSKFTPADSEEKSKLREEYGYSDDDFIMIYPADFSFRKNQPMLLKALKEVTEKHKNVRLLLPGFEQNAASTKELCKELGLEKYVDFLDYRRDIDKLDGLSDVSVSTSRQEGLPINLVEAMALGNAIVATDVRGNRDLVDNGENGFLVKLNDYSALAEKLDFLIENRSEIDRMGQSSAKKVEKYSIPKVNESMLKIYRELSLL